MHIENNVGVSVIGTLEKVPSKTKNGLKPQKYFESLGLKPKLLTKPIQGGILLLAASCTLKTKERDIILGTLKYL